jgi:hypothetical protein
MLTAERAEITARTADGDHADAKRLSAGLGAAPLTIETARSLTRNGESFYLIEGGRSFNNPDPNGCTGMWTGATARRDRGGVLHAVDAWSYLVCNELHVNHVPLALLERDGASCWLLEWVYEDGSEFGLSRPTAIAKRESACDIK